MFMGEMRYACAVCVGKSERKRTHGKPKSTWDDNVETDPKELVFYVVVWIQLAQDIDQWCVCVRAVVNTQ
jgi:hypothetical protein